MFWIDVISRVVHVFTAITLVGGSVFMAFVLMPAAKQLPDDAHQTLRVNLLARWKRFVHMGILLFLVSGFYNYVRLGANHDGDGLYHALVGTKMLLAFFVFFIASALVGKSAGLQRIRDKREFWLKVIVVATATIVAMSGFVKVRGVVTPTDEAATVSETGIDQ